jgi:uncharacterized phage protein gp47/JayE
MGLPSKTFQQFVDSMVAQWTASLGFPPTLPDGDPLLALMQTTAAQLVFMQAQVQLVNAVARAQTSTGADLDSFYAQFGFTRLPAQAAEGPVVFSNATPATAVVLVPVGTVVQTIGGAIQYAVVADTNQPTFDPIQNAYVLQVGQSSLTATAKALVAGSSYNVTVGQLAQIGTPVPGINSVTNTETITNGADAESDAAFRSRFVLYINSLSKATYGAIVSAITSVQQGLEYDLEENVDITGAPHPGEFVAAIDDGTGAPSSALITAIFNAVDAVRGFTIMPQVIAAPVNTVSIVIVIKVASGFVSATVETAVQNAIITVVNNGQIGAPLYVSDVIDAAKNVSGVVAVQPGTTTLDGFNADLPGVIFHSYRTDINHVTLSTY